MTFDDEDGRAWKRLTNVARGISLTNNGKRC